MTVASLVVARPGRAGSDDRLKRGIERAFAGRCEVGAVGGCDSLDR